MAKILILDDEKVRHDAYDKIYAGHEVWHAYDGVRFRWCLLNRGPFHLVHFDHDLGAVDETGLDLARWMLRVVSPPLLPDRCVVHSWNPTGAQRIFDELHRAGLLVVRRPFAAEGYGG